MERITAFTLRILGMAVLTSLAERLLPEGGLKSASSVAIGLTFVFAIAAELTSF